MNHATPLKISSIRGLNEDHRAPDTFFNDGASKRFSLVG
jgi:hypothetical protein